MPRSRRAVLRVYRRRLRSIRHSLGILRSDNVTSGGGELRGNLRGQRGGLGTGLRTLGRGLNRGGSSYISFRTVNVSRVFISRYRCFGGLVFRAHRAEITKVNGARNSRHTVGLLITVHSVRRQANESLNTAFLSNAIIMGTLARLCILFGCLQPGRLSHRYVDYFST